MIIIQNVSKSTTDKVLFAGISFKVGEGQKVGLVGPNGVGKTTLLNIIAGLDEPDSGSVNVSQERIGYLPQKLVADSSTEIGEYLQPYLKEVWMDYQIDEMLGKVGLKQVGRRTLITKLSGGQKMKVGLAGVLLSEPTTLILDEPTNNLDVASIEWLERFVQNFPGKVLVVSHDRFFLDACVNKIIELDPFSHQIEEYGGNYTAYREQKEVRHQHHQEDFRRQQLKEQHMKDWIVQKQEQLKYHPSNKVARQLQAMKTRMAREIDGERIARPQTYSSFKVQSIGDSLHDKKTVLMINDFSIHQLLQVPQLHIQGQERINLLGPNGAGKTTFIKSILGLSQFYTGSIELGPNIQLGYFSQEHELLDPNETVIKTLLKHVAQADETAARTILGKFLFSKDRVFSQVQFLSEGEKARLHLAILILQKNDFLLLDEPTNHLDLESREVLATALSEYPGGFLVVSHDRYFLQQIGITRTLVIKNGKIL
jgi:ATP-binding cassette, subfamily F, member 3